MKRFVIVGASFRCYSLFVTRLTEQYGDRAEITGVYDINKVRCQVFKDKIGDKCTVYDDFDAMLDAEKPDSVIVTTIDKVHHEYVVRALDKGYDVLCEKPVTNTYEKCLAIREAEKRSGHKVTITFNCRYMPYFAQIKHTVRQNRIGKILAINYEYCLDRWHGGDYLKRWHRMMENSQGMLLHKSTHHFDIVNWLTEDEPSKVTALANRVYYGDASKAYGERCSTCTRASECESFQSQTAEMDKKLYFDAEQEDGYVRDKCSFLPDSDIYDNMSVSVLYKKGALLTYSLNLFSEHEGYRMVITGEKGVLIANCWDDDKSPQNHIQLLLPDGVVEDIAFDKSSGTHGGGDDRMLAMLLNEGGKDELNQRADGFDGFTSAMIGIAGNMSILEGKTIDVAKYIDTLRA